MMVSTSQETSLRSTMAVIRTRAPLFVPLLVITLLVCHGTLGSMDRPVLEPVPAVAAHQISGEAGEPVPADEHPIEHSLAHGHYVVAFLTVFLGLLGLLSRDASPTRRVAIALRQSRCKLASDVLCPNPKVTPTLLQVFRL